jgi:CubicO group peptidase (beta-lactamase class C family)
MKAMSQMPGRGNGLDRDLFRQFERRLDRALGELPAPGLNASILVDNTVVWTYSTGYAQFNPEVPLTPQHLHRIGSITKVFTAHAILLLRDRGKLDLDTPVRTYIPEFSAPGTDGITIRHVLCHGAGIISEGPDVWDSGVFPDEQEFRELISRFQPVLPPMMHVKYSNVAYSMLGLVIRAASGVPYEHFMNESLLRPLGMHNTTFQLESELQDRLARGHIIPVYQRRFEPTPQQNLRAYSSCGMLASTMADVLKLAQLQWAANPLLPELTRREMHRVHLMNAFPPGWNVGFGLGWRLSRHGDQIYSGHEGSYMGNKCVLQISLAERVAIAVFANRGGAQDVERLAVDLLSETIEALRSASSAPIKNGPIPAELAGLLGNYGSRYWFQVRIEYASDGLLLIVSGNPNEKIQLAPIPGGRFRITGGRWIGEELSVGQRDSEGPVKGIILAGFPLRRI